MNKIKLDDKFFYYQVFYKNNKNMYLRYKKDRLIITCNKRITIKQIEDFILKNKNKILKLVKNKIEVEPLYNKEFMLVLGQKYFIEYTLASLQNSIEFIDNKVIISFKKDYFDYKYIEQYYKELTLKKTEELYLKHYNKISKYININKVIFKTQLMKSRFGSCIKSTRTIKLNSFLSRFSEIYLEAVLIHELVHLAISNHQKEFYKYVNLFIPNYKISIKELNKLKRKYVN